MNWKTLNIARSSHMALDYMLKKCKKEGFNWLWWIKTGSYTELGDDEEQQITILDPYNS